MHAGPGCAWADDLHSNVARQLNAQRARETLQPGLGGRIHGIIRAWEPGRDGADAHQAAVGFAQPGQQRAGQFDWRPQVDSEQLVDIVWRLCGCTAVVACSGVVHKQVECGNPSRTQPACDRQPDTRPCQIGLHIVVVVHRRI